MDVESEAAIRELALMLTPGEKRRGEVIVNLQLGGGQTQKMRLGWDFALDGELIERLEAIDGISHVSLRPQRTGGHLRQAA